jgi:hypothetical protein
LNYFGQIGFNKTAWESYSSKLAAEPLPGAWFGPGASLGMTPVEASLPDWPYDSLDLILFAEAAAAFEELTLAGGLKELKAQVPDAWPNLFRQARFLSALDFVQADRFSPRRGSGDGAHLFPG